MGGKKKHRFLGTGSEGGKNAPGRTLHHYLLLLSERKKRFHAPLGLNIHLKEIQKRRGKREKVRQPAMKFPMRKKKKRRRYIDDNTNILGLPKRGRFSS